MSARLGLLTTLLAVLAAGVALGAPAPPPPQSTSTSPAEVGSPAPTVPFRHSLALGAPTRGRLVAGVQFPVAGPDHLTWDNVFKRVPNRGWRRWGTYRLVTVVLRVLHEYRLANPGAPRVLVGDLSRPHGGSFGAQFGGLGHFSHQNGRDADIYYPRRDGLPLEPARVAQIDHRLAADLVRRFVAAGAVVVYVGPHTGLSGPRRVVRARPHHDNHLHVRVRP